MIPRYSLSQDFPLSIILLTPYNQIMNRKEAITNELGTPDIELSYLSIWVKGRQFPSNKDYWDGNWLNVICLYETVSSNVEITGPYIRIDEIKLFCDSVNKIYIDLSGEAE